MQVSAGLSGQLLKMPGATSAKAKRPTSQIATIYLAAWNLFNLYAWVTLSARLVNHFVEGKSASTVYPSLGNDLWRLQCFALLEVLHAAVKLVPSSPLTAMMQIGGRLSVLFLALQHSPAAQLHPDVCCLGSH